MLNVDDISMTTVDEVTKKCVAIVRFGPSGFNTDGLHAGEYFQVTIDPNMVSPSGEFIRFGTIEGDEILGWQRCKAICVIEVLGDWVGDRPPSVQYGLRGITKVI